MPILVSFILSNFSCFSSVFLILSVASGWESFKLETIPWSLYLNLLNSSSTTALGIFVGLLRWSDPSVCKLTMKKCLLATLKTWNVSQVIYSFKIWISVFPSFLKRIAAKKPWWKAISGGKYFLTVQIRNTSSICGNLTRSTWPTMKNVSKMFFYTFIPFKRTSVMFSIWSPSNLPRILYPSLKLAKSCLPISGRSLTKTDAPVLFLLFRWSLIRPVNSFRP